MKTIWVFLFAFASAVAFAQDAPDTGAHLPSQAAADVLRSFAGADAAFMAAGLVKAGYTKDNLASLLQYPTDEVVLVTLTGAQVRQALERSVSLFPEANDSFLQLSEIEASFSKSAPVGQRIKSVTVGGSPLNDSRSYTIAMPSSLGRGGLGYFKIWDKSKITKTFANVTVESVLKGKKFADTSPRWSVLP